MDSIKLLLPDTDIRVDPQVVALAHLLADPTIPEYLKIRVRTEVVTIVARAYDQAAQESEGERS